MNRLRLLIAFGIAAQTVLVQCWIPTCTIGRQENIYRFLREPRLRFQPEESSRHLSVKELINHTVRESAMQKSSSEEWQHRWIAFGAAVLVFLFTAPRLAMASTSPAVIAAVSASAEPMVTAATTSPVISGVASTAAPKLGALYGPALSMAMEIRLCLRLIVAALAGALVGWERSSSKHAAGVRTLSLVSMAAAAYTICSSFGFIGFPRVDPSRMASNVASGVGFIGAGVITTSTIQQRQQDDNTGVWSKSSLPNTVHGLTTAAAIWLSAAVGVACGVGLYFVATTAALTTIAILRFGRVKPALPRPGQNKTKSKKQQGSNHTTKVVTDLELSSWDGSGQHNDLPSMANKILIDNSRSTTTPKYIDDEMELVVRSAWQTNGTEGTASIFASDGLNLVPSVRGTSSFGNNLSEATP